MGIEDCRVKSQPVDIHAKVGDVASGGEVGVSEKCSRRPVGRSLALTALPSKNRIDPVTRRASQLPAGGRTDRD
jgi:hypothetical protein